METLPTTDSCFVCGRSNPIGLHMHFETDGERVRARFAPKPEHVGFKGVIHGGLISTVLDEIMVWACGVKTQRFAYCAELNVRFIRPARVGTDLQLTAWLVTNRRDRIFEAAAELREGEMLLASGTGKYLPIPDSELPPMLEEFGVPSVAEIFRTR
jgi:uncharacterized protein (TIGR00369 family)